MRDCAIGRLEELAIGVGEYGANGGNRVFGFQWLNGPMAQWLNSPISRLPQRGVHVNVAHGHEAIGRIGQPDRGSSSRNGRLVSATLVSVVPSACRSAWRAPQSIAGEMYRYSRFLIRWRARCGVRPQDV